MKASEFRIGNILADGIVVKTIDETGINIRYWEDDGPTWDGVFNLKDGELIKPEPLTEEWLVKFGFGSHTEGYYNLPYIHFLNDEFTLSVGNYGVYYIEAPNRELQHVHQTTKPILCFNR